VRGASRESAFLTLPPHPVAFRDSTSPHVRGEDNERYPARSRA
jgi:hypothetical protein